MHCLHSKRQPLCPSELPPHYAPGNMVLLPSPQGGDCDPRLSGALIQLVGGAGGPDLGLRTTQLGPELMPLVPGTPCVFLEAGGLRSVFAASLSQPGGSCLARGVWRSDPPWPWSLLAQKVFSSSPSSALQQQPPATTTEMHPDFV